MRFFTATVLGLLTSSLAAATNLTSPSRLALPADFKPQQVFKNTNLVRNTNLEKGYVRETINVVVENIDKKAQSDYYIPFSSDVFERVGGFEVRDKKATDKGRFVVDATEVVSARYASIGTKEKTQWLPYNLYVIGALELSLTPPFIVVISTSLSIFPSLWPRNLRSLWESLIPC
jgi:hypothetical protein